MSTETLPSSRLPVESSAVSGVNYYPHINMLEMEFRSGAIYVYFDVPAEIYRTMLREDSLGRYFNAHIRDRYRFMRLR